MSAPTIEQLRDEVVSWSRLLAAFRQDCDPSHAKTAQRAERRHKAAVAQLEAALAEAESSAKALEGS